MSPNAPSTERRLMHARATLVQVYARNDGLFDVEAELRDTKTRDMQLSAGIRKAGEPVHDMLLTLVVDARLNILEASSDTRAMPYPGRCEHHGNAYAQLVGLNLLKGFRAAVKQKLSGVLGCTHLTELCNVLPTAVIQAFAGEVIDTREGSEDGTPPFQLDRCHALRRDGPVVQTHYPRWYRQGQALQAESTATPLGSS
ncbi:DUF2889 domain-containing protein [Pelomonas sp. SE-A7]|uniref:DUF2889 domain-containing protein n=1 Tax=Pelomonas sp. SE-A7 TaxID=3054953 RepID=UPI00259CA4B9|nr:DUF2889 domain-containing protein [Pelomonas sp. SE-A7]MDM4767064.1 DUF2889 domain-containing protein [Pelomonas sp. SE-A7]